MMPLFSLENGCVLCVQYENRIRRLFAEAGKITIYRTDQHFGIFRLILGDAEVRVVDEMVTIDRTERR